MVCHEKITGCREFTTHIGFTLRLGFTKGNCAIIVNTGALTIMDLSDKQYGVLLELYHEFQYAFNSLDREIKNTFFERLYAKWELTPSLTAELSQ